MRAVVLAANGPAFSAGHDLKELTARRTDADGGRAYFRAHHDDLQRHDAADRALPQPVIAEVQGVATAAGCQLVATCDLAVASTAAKFATPGVDIGLFCSTPMVALSRNVARKHAMEMLLTGDLISAEEAARIGLVNRVGRARQRARRGAGARAQDRGEIDARREDRQGSLLPPARDGAGEPMPTPREVMVENMLARDAEEGIGAFLEKREPQWEDR